MKLSNPPCRKAKKCLPFCGICNLRGEPRLIIDESLFGVCRTVGKCICKQWSDTDNCKWINGKNVKNKRLQAGTFDCNDKEHPHHHTIQVSDRELAEEKQADYNQMAKTYKSMYKEMSGLWGGYRQWSNK